MMARWGMIIITWERHKALNVPEHKGEEICMQNEITTEIPFEKKITSQPKKEIVTFRQSSGDLLGDAYTLRW